MVVRTYVVRTYYTCTYVYPGTCTYLSTRVPFGTRVHVYVRTYVPWYVLLTYNDMSQLSDWKRAHTCTYHGTTCTVYVHVYVRTYNVMSQLSDWKRAHMCTENHVCFGRIHGSQLREGANAGQHTPTLSLPPSHHCLDGEVYPPQMADHASLPALRRALRVII